MEKKSSTCLRRVLVALIALGGLVGCTRNPTSLAQSKLDEPTGESAPPAALLWDSASQKWIREPHVSRLEYQRFLPIASGEKGPSSWAALFALDTKTGQLCRTVAQTSRATEPFPELASAPSCLAVLAKYPD